MSEYILTSRRCWARFLIVAWLLLSLITASPAFGGVKVAELRCEWLVNPLGIDATQPRLGWMLKTDERARSQYAYQILVASTEAKLKVGKADLWDSGQVVSSQSVLVPYAGKTLKSHAPCFWKVRVWSDKKTVSGWSQPAQWTMGILTSDEWRAKWIGLDGDDKANVLTDTSWIWFPEGNPAQGAPLETNWFRKEITLPADRKVKRAIFQYTGDNECRGWLDEFDLGARNNYKSVKWNDITQRLHPGQTYVFGLVGRNTGLEVNPAGVIGSLIIEFDQGEPLVIRTDAGWKVSKVLEPGWNKKGFDDSKWEAAKIIGPASMEPWGEPRTAEDRRFPARWLRTEFALAKKIQRATVYYSGLGSSELYVNGQKIGDAVLSPAVAQYDKRAFYVTHDVTELLKRGANAMGVVLGGGRFASDRSKIYSGTVNFGWPKLMLHLRVDHTDGSVSEVVSDETWKVATDGPILTSGEYDGEEYDARKELGPWSKPGYSMNPQYERALEKPKPQPAGSGTISNTAALPRWQPVQLVSAPGPLSAQMIEPIRVTETIKPISYREVKPGVLIYDMGQNMVGWCRLKVKGAAETKVLMRFAETLNPDGTLYMANLRGAKVTDSYILHGGSKEVWEPRFTYHGFRYVEVTGLPGKTTLDAIEGRVVHDDLGYAGEFVCANPLLNQIWTNVFWGTRGNYRSMPTDCPQRDERQGWLGDRSEESRGESYLFDISKLYPKWLQDISDAQRPSGSIPDVAPAYWPIYSDNVTWPSTLIIAPSVLERQYGDTGPIKERYDSAKKWLDYMNRFVTNGIIARDSYGDWCVPPEDPKLIHSKDPVRQTAKPLLATAYFYNNLKLMERYARLLGKADDAAHFAKWAEEIKTAFNAKFLDRDKGYYDNGSQTSCVLPLAFGLVPEEFRASVFKQLVDKITNETKGHIGTGLIGGQYLCRVLSDNGRPDLVYQMATKTEYPGWGYMIANGATTIWELWNGNTADPTMNSGNHVMLVGDLVIWLNEYLAGIAADPEQPGFKHIVMKPYPVADLDFARATHRSPYGLISSDWRKETDSQKSKIRFVWQIEVPPNTTATAYVPTMAKRVLTESGRSLDQARGVKFLRTEGDRMVVQLGSGKYQLISE
jgi:alpha-L-rhamnosidase